MKCNAARPEIDFISPQHIYLSVIMESRLIFRGIVIKHPTLARLLGTLQKIGFSSYQMLSLL